MLVRTFDEFTVRAGLRRGDIVVTLEADDDGRRVELLKLDLVARPHIHVYDPDGDQLVLPVDGHDDITITCGVLTYLGDLLAEVGHQSHASRLQSSGVLAGVLEAVEELVRRPGFAT